MSSLFGFNGSLVAERAYDMCVIEDLRTQAEKAEHERKKRQQTTFNEIEFEGSLISNLNKDAYRI